MLGYRRELELLLITILSLLAACYDAAFNKLGLI